MNPLASLYLQAVLQAKSPAEAPQKSQKIMAMESKSKPIAPPSMQSSLQYLQKQQLLNLIQHQQRHKDMECDVSQQSSINGVQVRMANYLNQQLRLKETVLKLTDEYPNHQLPYVIRVIANIVVHALQNIPDEQSILKQQYRQNPLLITLSYELWRAISGLIVQNQVHLIRSDNSNLFAKQQDNIIRFVGQMVLFREEYNEKIFTNLHAYQVDQSQGLIPQLSLNHLHQFLIRSKDDVWTAFIYKWFNYDRSKVHSLTRQQCLFSFQSYTTILNHYFKKDNLILNTVQNNVKDTKQIHNDRIFQEYLMLMGTFKASTQDFFKKILTHFFVDDFPEQELELIDFSQKTLSFHKSQNNELMFILPKVIQLETQLIDHIYNQASQDIKQEQQVNNSNYYIKMIQKLKSKCVYNGEDQCECKKCQCIRRNRNSARESQKKKRDALEKIGPLQENYEVLRKKVHTLEEENNILRGLLIDVFKHPALQQISSQFIEPLTKVISADSEDFVQKTSYLTEC